MSNIIPFLPGMTPTTIFEEEVTPGRLSALLDMAFIDHKIDEDGDVYVTDGVDFPLWISIETRRKLVVLFTYCSVGDQPERNWLAEVNEMNGQIAVPQFAYRGNAIWGGHWISYDGGLNVRQFVKMLRLFGGAFRAGLQLHEGETVASSEQPLSNGIPS